MFEVIWELDGRCDLNWEGEGILFPALKVRRLGHIKIEL